MKNVGSSSRGSRRKETFFSQLPTERLSPHKSHNLGSHFSMVWVTATEAAPEVNREWSPDKGKNILNAPSGLSAPLWEPARTEQGRKGFGALRWTKGPGLRFLTTDSLQNLRRTHTHLHISDHQWTSSTWKRHFHPPAAGQLLDKLTRQDRGGAHSKGQGTPRSAAGPPHQPPSSWAGQSRRGLGLPGPWGALLPLDPSRLSLQNYSLPDKMISLGKLSYQELSPELESRVTRACA